MPDRLENADKVSTKVPKLVCKVARVGVKTVFRNVLKNLCQGDQKRGDNGLHPVWTMSKV